MATTTRSQVQGFAEIDKVLKALPGRLAEAELTSATRASAVRAGHHRDHCSEMPQIDFSWSGELGDLELPDGVTLDALKDAAQIVDDYERYICDPYVPLDVHGDGDSAVMMVLRVFERLVRVSE